LDVLKRSLSGVLPGEQDHIPPGQYIPKKIPGRLAQQTLGPVALDGPTHAFPSGDPKPQPIWLGWGHNQHDKRVGI
jgi:hypothetical protein